VREVAVIVVLYRGGGTAVRCVEALHAAWDGAPTSAHSLKVIAVDNASRDGTPERLRAAHPSVNLVMQDRNTGFAAACNRGLREVAPDVLVAFLNPDVAVGPGFFRALLKVTWDDTLGGIGPQIRSADGSLEQSARAFPTAATGVFGRTTLLSRVFPGAKATQRQLLAQPERGRVAVDWVSGACLITSRQVIDAVGPFDEGYWMYWEDADWCRRATDLGFRIEYHPELLVRHHQGSSSRSRPFTTIVAFHRSAARYYRTRVTRSRLSGPLAQIALGGRLLVKLAEAAIRR